MRWEYKRGPGRRSQAAEARGWSPQEEAGAWSWWQGLEVRGDCGAWGGQGGQEGDEGRDGSRGRDAALEAKLEGLGPGRDCVPAVPDGGAEDPVTSPAGDCLGGAGMGGDHGVGGDVGGGGGRAGAGDAVAAVAAERSAAEPVALKSR